jgi:hypothetical protein
MRHPFRRLLALRKKEPDLHRIRKIARKLEVGRLMTDPDESAGLDGSELLSGSRPRLFGYYSAAGVAYALGEFGIFALIEDLGYRNLEVNISGDVWTQDLQIHGQAQGLPQLVVEGRFRRSTWKPSREHPLNCELRSGDLPVVYIEWFLLQNPLADFTRDRPRLPGQKHPGLGIRDEVMEVLYAVARRLDLEAYLAKAKLFHNAFMYSPIFFFVDPQRQAELMAIRQAGQGRSLQDMTLAVEAGLLRDGQGQVYQWTGDLMIHPLSESLEEAFSRCGYRRTVEELAGRLDFVFDWPALDAQKPDLIRRFIEEQGLLTTPD